MLPWTSLLGEDVLPADHTLPAALYDFRVYFVVFYWFLPVNQSPEHCLLGKSVHNHLCHADKLRMLHFMYEANQESWPAYSELPDKQVVIWATGKPWKD